jgi:hypothetical protein
MKYLIAGDKTDLQLAITNYLQKDTTICKVAPNF